VRIHADGTSILLVEQNAQMALNVASRGYVLQSGQIMLADSAANLSANAQVREAYLGVA
jgi:branched-chain amino acid transport system ATP-binding protein